MPVLWADRGPAAFTAHARHRLCAALVPLPVAEEADLAELEHVHTAPGRQAARSMRS